MLPSSLTPRKSAPGAVVWIGEPGFLGDQRRLPVEPLEDVCLDRVVIVASELLLGGEEDTAAVIGYRFKTRSARSGISHAGRPGDELGDAA